MEKLKTVSMTAYTNWFCKASPLCVTDDKIIKIGVPDSFFGDWLRDHYSDILENCLSEAGHKLGFEFIGGYPAPEKNIRAASAAIVKEEDDAQGLLFADDPLFAKPVAETSAIQDEVKKETAVPLAAVNGKIQGLHFSAQHMHTFKNFIVGEENRYAYETIKRVSDSPGTMFNPLYIYGGTGVGKTHLIQAIGYAALEKNPNLTIRYTSCEALLNEFVELIQGHKSMYEFRLAMRDVDILLIDDVHILGKSPRLQEEFFNTFNTLYNAHKQIVLTSDKQPCDIEGLEDRLVSRFESGMTLEVLAPEFETRLAILRALRDDNNIKTKLSDSVLEFIANNITSSVRRLKGAFVRVTTYANMNKTINITVAHAERLLSAIIAKEIVAKTIYIDDIQRTVAQYFNLKVSDILSNARPKNIAEPRMAAMYLCRKLTKHSLPEIGASFGKNHATIINATKKIPELCEKSEEFRRSIEQIERQLTRH